MIQRIIFFGSSKFCIPILKSLHTNFELVGIVTRPDKPIGRKQTLAPSDPKLFAQKNNITYYTPENAQQLILLKNDITALHADISVVADYGMIIPKIIFEIPTFQTINIHFSKLPKLRGASPVQYTILLGEKNAWVSVIKLQESLDTGDIIWQKEFPIIGTPTTQVLYQYLFEEIAIKLPTIISDFTSKTITPIPQDNAQATFTRRLTRQDGFIPWEILTELMKGITPSPTNLENWPFYKTILSQFPISPSNWLRAGNFQFLISNMMRAFDTWPGIWTEIAIQSSNKPINQLSNTIKKRLKILNLHLEKEKLVIDTVQLEGKTPVRWEEFRHSFYPTIV